MNNEKKSEVKLEDFYDRGDDGNIYFHPEKFQAFIKQIEKKAEERGRKEAYDDAYQDGFDDARS